jgi:SAM-dependent methyltransferase
MGKRVTGRIWALVSTTSTPKGNTYDKYASKNPVEQRLMSGFFAAFDELLPKQHPTAVLEVGVGEGEISERVRHRFPDAEMVGIDLPDKELATSWKERGLVGAFADISRLPFPDDTFDLVLGIEVLEHVPDPAAALGEIARVARGTVLVSVPREPIWRIANMARGRYWSDLGNTPGHIQHWSRRSFVGMVGRYLDVTEVRSPLPWTFAQGRARPGSGARSRGAGGAAAVALADYQHHDEQPGDQRDDESRPAPARRVV